VWALLLLCGLGIAVVAFVANTPSCFGDLFEAVFNCGGFFVLNVGWWLLPHMFGIVIAVALRARYVTMCAALLGANAALVACALLAHRMEPNDAAWAWFLLYPPAQIGVMTISAWLGSKIAKDEPSKARANPGVQLTPASGRR
jgi:hypothetical protein